MNYNILAYTVYILTIIYVVVVVGNSLYKNGIGFLINTFKGDTLIANSVNKFLITGYYLINIGYSVYVLKIGIKVESFMEMINVLSHKLGIIVIALGIMHLFNITLLALIGKKRKTQTLP